LGNEQIVQQLMLVVLGIRKVTQEQEAVRRRRGIMKDRQKVMFVLDFVLLHMLHEAA